MHFFLIPSRRYCNQPPASQITEYARLGQIQNARKLFEDLRVKTTASWNSIIAAYFQNHLPWEARALFDQMPHRNTISWNGLLSGYVKNKMLTEARNTFDQMPRRDVVSWTAMVRGYVEAGMIFDAESLFWKIPEKNVVSWTVMLGGLIHSGQINKALRLFEMMPVKDAMARTTMISGLCQEGRLEDARNIFDEMTNRTVFTWTVMINGYLQNLKVDIARKLFEVMPDKNDVSWAAMLMGYIRCGRMNDALEIFTAMPEKSIVTCTSMILGFGQNGEADKARKLFDQMSETDEVTWSSMIKVYEVNGFQLEALDLFALMQEGKSPLNAHTLIAILSVCGSFASLDHGRQIHAQLFKSRFNSDQYVASTLITMYVKCGDLVKAKTVFDGFSPKDTVMWNSIITGYSKHGLGKEALEGFHDMCRSNITPDEITFVSVLSACSYTGNIREGIEIFRSMRSKYQIEPGASHYACMVDLLGRAGHLKEAMCLITKMPVEANTFVWGALLGGCRSSGNLKLAEAAVNELSRLEPKNTGPCILLSWIYASKGKWHEASNVRIKMKERNIHKRMPGYSWIEVEKKVHTFRGGDQKHNQNHPEIGAIVEKLRVVLKEGGYCQDGSFVLHDA